MTERTPRARAAAPLRLQGGHAREDHPAFPLRLALVALVLLLLPPPALPASSDDEPSLEQIMAHPDWLGRAPQRPYWADDSGSFYYHRKREGEEALDLYQVDLQGKLLRRVEDEERGTADIAGGRFNLERTRKVYSRRGDIYVKNLATGAVRQLTRTGMPESEAFFLADGRVAYRRGPHYFVRDLTSGLEWQPFDVRTEQDPEQERAEKRREPDYLRDQQERLFDWIRRQEEKRSRAESRRREEQEKDASRVDLPYYLGKKRKPEEVLLSPSGRFLLLSLRAVKDEEGRADLMPRYVTDSGYVETEEVRVKVGTGEAMAESLLLLDRQRHRQIELDLTVLPGITDDPLAELRAAAEERRRQAAAEAKAGETEPEGAGESEEEGETLPAGEGESEGEGESGRPKARPVQISRPLWSDDGKRVVFQAFSRDNKDRWIATLDLEAGTVIPLHRTTDPAWINWRFRDLGFLRDHRTLYFLSEESGYSQLYLLDVEGGKLRRLTQGDFVVAAVTLSADGRHLYYTANPDHPGIYEVFRVSVAGGPAEQLTRLGGRNGYVLSPDDSSLLITHSTTTAPPELYLQEVRPGANPRRVTDTISDTFLDLPWVAPEIVEVPSSHVERRIVSRLYLPPAPNAGPRPAVIFIHGAGYLQNAHHGWSSYFREFMFHTLLARHGYVVLDMDYRGSAGYGRDWRTAIYRQMGSPELEDLADGVAWLAANHNVDPDRVGVYGGSYGGFLTLMALFRQPELFAAGAALRPVTDWAHYNHPYTANILNTPDLDPEAYERSSPIEYAEGLSRPLLICTGMLDNNVLFQDSVRLVQRLIELEKEDWEIAIYPVEPHGFREPSGWLDEYRRILKLFERHLR